MKSKTLERFKNQEFYIKCNTKDENLMIRHICEMTGFNIFRGWGTFEGHPRHYLSYEKIFSQKVLFASASGIKNFVMAKDFMKKVKKEMGELSMESKTLERFRNEEFYIICSIESENLMIRRICEENGFNIFRGWGTFDGHPYHYLSYKEKTEIGKKALFASMGDIKNFVTADYFIREVEKEMNEFTKYDLVSGMIVKLRNYPEKYVVIGENLVSLNGFMQLDRYSKNLKCIKATEFDIVEIYAKHTAWGCGFEEGLKRGNYLWKESPEPTEAEKQLSEAKVLLSKAHKAIEEAEAKMAEEK